MKKKTKRSLTPEQAARLWRTKERRARLRIQELEAEVAILKETIRELEDQTGWGALTPAANRWT